LKRIEQTNSRILEEKRQFYGISGTTKKDIAETYKEAYVLWRGESNAENNYRCNTIFKSVELRFKS
jgi:hypothetical protein